MANKSIVKKKRVESSTADKMHKNITILYASFPGLTALLKGTVPKQTSTVKKSFHGFLREIAKKYEGILNKFFGETIMILFGASKAHEDDPERAVYTAIDIMSELEKFNEKHKGSLSVHIGINSGLVIVKKSDREKGMDFDIAGDAVNCAKQLMKIAKEDILVSESIHKSTEYLFKMRRLRTIETRVKSSSIVPYKVIGIKEVTGRKRVAHKLYSPLIGRNKEFETMKKALDRVVESKGMVVSISGEAGIGKSRLVNEFKKIAMSKVSWLSGRCPSYGKGFSFWVFLEQIRSYLRVQDSGLECESRKIVGEKTGRVFKERTNEYLPYLCVFLSIKVLEHMQEKVKYLDPESLRLQEFVSVKTLFRDIARNRPLVLYFEDMHWIDPESLELLRFLLDGLKDEPVLFLFETRIDKARGVYKIGDFIKKIYKKRHREIGLGRLSTKDAQILIQNLLKISGLPAKALDLILEKSEGNPFYIEEIIHSLIESGILGRKGGKWILAKETVSFEVPGSIDAVIQSRIDRLPPEARNVLITASVIGKSFLYKILSTISGSEDLKNNVALLEERQFLQKKITSFQPSRFPTDTEYQFRHILIREVAYSRLEKKKRMEIHRKVAESIEDIFGEKTEEYFEILAYHYYNALILDKSYDYYIRAGDRAKRLYNNNVAIDCYAKAIAIHKKLFPESGNENMGELFEKIGDVEEINAEYEKAIKDYECAFGYYKDKEKRGEIKRKIGHIFSLMGEYNVALANYEEVISMLKNIPDSPILSKTLINYGFVLADWKNNYEKAQKTIEDALGKIDKKKESRIYARALTTLGNVLLLKGDYNKALKYHKRALAIYERLNEKKGIVAASNNIGNLYHDRGELDIALQYYENGLVTSEAIGYRSGIGALSGNIGVVYWKKGECEKALKYCKAYLSISEEIGDRTGVGRASSKIGTIYFDKGELETALEFYKRYISISEEIGDKLGVGIASGDIGSIYHNKGEFNIALDYYNRFLSVAEEIGYRAGIGVASCNIGILYYDKGQFGRAKRYLEKSEKILQEVGDKVNLLQVFASLADLNTAQGNYGSAVVYSKKALSLVRETGAREKEVIALRSLGKALSKTNVKQSISYLRESVSLAEQQKMRLDIAQSSYELAKVLKSAGKDKEARKYIESAKRTFKNSGAYGLLEKLEKRGGKSDEE